MKPKRQMRLKLDLEGVDFELRISGYKKPKEGIEEWCKTEISIYDGAWFNYHSDNTTMDSGEVLWLCGAIGDFLDSKIKKTVVEEFLEPDLAFLFVPETEEREPHGDIDNLLNAIDYWLTEPHVRLAITFWNGAPTTNHVFLTFFREELERLHCYLKYVTKQITDDDADVIKYMNEGTLYSIY